jgi:N6-adenosine-specific RNA methylase IME4
VAIEVYARQAKNQELETAAAKIRLRAERRLGEIMGELHAEGRIHKGGRPSGETGSHSEPVSQVKLADLGIDKKLSSRAQDLAALPDEAFGGLLEDVDRKGGLGEKIARDMLRQRHQAAGRAEFRQRVADEGCAAEDLEALIKARRRFGVIYMDPPWAFATRSERGQDRAAANHYRVDSLDAIAALCVPKLAADDCVLLMWTTWPFLPKALGLIEAYGFTYKTCGFDWMKVNGDGSPAIGNGYWTRANTEPCLLATKGAPARLDAGVPMALLAPPGQHSAKPEEIAVRIERLLGGPYLELYARKERPGWTTWGNEIARKVFEADLERVGPDEEPAPPAAAPAGPYAGDRSRKWDDEMGTKIAALYEGRPKHNMQQIADELGIYRGQVKGIYRRFKEKRQASLA